MDYELSSDISKMFMEIVFERNLDSFQSYEEIYKSYKYFSIEVCNVFDILIEEIVFDGTGVKESIGIIERRCEKLN